MKDVARRLDEMEAQAVTGAVDGASPAVAETSKTALERVTVGQVVRHDATVTLVEPDPDWPRQFEVEAARVRSALGTRVQRLEHVGSTSIPGLVAKPVIDLLLVVPDSADETAYVPDLEAAGFALRIREPDWYEHRVFKGPTVNINLHVFSPGSPEIERMVVFRNHLRQHRADRDRYARAKAELAGRTWAYIQDYADAKTHVVEEIIARAQAAGTAW